MNKELRMSTVQLVKRILKPWMEESVISVCEYQCISSNLKYLADHEQLKPVIVPKLIEMSEVAEMLGISLGMFKKSERLGLFPFKRKMIGTSVRYRNTDIIDYIMNGDDAKANGDTDGREDESQSL